MSMAMEMAENARGKCSPNPFVGAILVKADKVIGQGWTREYGGDHAEVQAIKNAAESTVGAELYVTLEPCAHYGKTPPCANAIIAAGITKVYAGITDPNPLVNGKGFEMLRAAGIEVQTGILEPQITRQLEYFLTLINRKRPFIILKTAQTLDGRIAAADGSSRWITCEASRKFVHTLRQEVDVVLTGIGTVLKDDPLLNVRLGNTVKQPVRAILDTQLRMPVNSQIVQTAKTQKTLIYTSLTAANTDRAAILTGRGIEIIPISCTPDGISLSEVLADLGARKFYAVLVEAGSRLTSTLLRAGLADKLVTFIAPLLLGGEHTTTQNLGIENIQAALKLTSLEVVSCGQDILITSYPEYS